MRHFLETIFSREDNTAIRFRIGDVPVGTTSSAVVRQEIVN